MVTRTCPDCETALVKISDNLTQLGYVAEDQTWQCPECRTSYPCGEPIGDFDAPIVEDTECPLCDGRGLMYQLHEAPERDITLRYKCEECYHVWTRDRDFEDGCINVGYPSVQGENTDDGYGY